MQPAKKQKPEADGWHIVKFGDVAQEGKGNSRDPLAEGLERYVGLEHIDPQSLRLSRWGMIAEDNPTFTKKFKAGQILFGRRRAYLKKAAVPDFDGICSGDITVIEPKGKLLLPELLPFIVQSDMFFAWAIKHSAGGLSPRTKFKSLAEFEFPLPPRERQEDIIKVSNSFSDCELKIVEAGKKLALLKMVVECAIIKDGGLSKNYSSKLSDLKLDAISKFTSGKLKTKTELKSYSDKNKIPVFGGNGINGYTDIPLIMDSNIIIGRVGEYCGAVYATEEPVWVTDNALYLKDLDKSISLPYFYALLKSLNLNQYKSQSGQPLINQSVVGALSVKIPSDTEQNKIGMLYRALENEARLLNERLQKIIHLRGLFIDNVLSGEQDHGI